MDAQSKAFLYRYLNNTSPVGFEASGQQIWLEYLQPYIHSYFTDTYGTAVAVVNPNQSYKVVIEAHADEISWFVNYISPEGYIYVIRNGGSDYAIAPSMRVNIHTEKGIVKGVFGWPAIHVRDEKDDPKPSQKNIVIDCGCDSREEVESLGIHVGCVVTYEDELAELNSKYFVGRALDNRIGGFMIAEVTRRLYENGIQLPYTLYAVNSVQEEVGLYGATMIARRLQADVAICTDVCHDTKSPLYDKIKSGEQTCGKGPVLTYGPAVQNNLLKNLIEVAQKENIPFQRAAVSRTTGTDTDAFAYAGIGTASALISLPLKYMHTTVEMVHREDIENIIRLIYSFLVQLPAGADFRYIK
ncbi:MAG: M20/M25/M40 family metallo-hydrolase [Cytophagales bacterium]|nr:M20/M25/M40 family metallo-hydrolase [Bernardetiaceae bacterium]MDW8204000.1 M20/M25/M40 family metallo-hydrolase [Cytophagales bacterium]